MGIKLTTEVLDLILSKFKLKDNVINYEKAIKLLVPQVGKNDDGTIKIGWNIAKGLVSK